VAGGVELRLLLPIDRLAPALDPLGGSELRPEDLGVDGLDLAGPVGLAGRDGEIDLGGEEVVEAPLADPGLIADLVDAHGAVALGPDQVDGCLEELLPRVGGASHGVREDSALD
jgi:hypothetical protein